MTNREFAQKNPAFRRACERAGLVDETAKPPKLPTKRQASKFRRGRGSAYRFRSEAQAA